MLMMCFNKLHNALVFIALASSLTILNACRYSFLEESKMVRDSLSLNANAYYPVTRSTISDDGVRSTFMFQKEDGIGFFAGNVLTNCQLLCTDAESGSFIGTVRLDEASQYEYHSSMTYYAYYPYDSMSGNEASSLSGMLSAIQSAPFDGHADYLVATPVMEVYDIEAMPCIDLHFDQHLFAIVKITVTNNSEELAQEKIKSIGLKSTGPALAGTFTFNVTDPTKPAVFSTDPELVADRVDVIYPESDLPTLGRNTGHSVYAIVHAAEYAAGELQVTVETSHYSFAVPTKSDVTLFSDRVTVLPTIDLSNQEMVSKSSNRFESFSITAGGVKYSDYYINDDCVFIHVPNGIDLSSSISEFSPFDGVSTVLIGSETQTSGEGEHNLNDFTTPLEYLVVGANGESRSYKLIISDFPVIIINTPSPITSRTDWTGGCEIKMIEDDGKEISFKSNNEVRGRGNATWSTPPKKSFTFKLSSKAEVLGMPEDKRWNLLANWYDRTLIRNTVALEIAHRSDGLAWTSHGRYVDMIMNDVFMGTYFLCEHNKISKYRVNITEMKTTDTSDEAITGGYLLELDNTKERPYFESLLCNYPVQIKNPDDDGFELQRAWIESYINDLEMILSDDGSLSAHKYLEYIDINSFIDWWFVYEIAGTPEPNIPRSCWMYKDRGGKLFAGPVWDFDQMTFQPGMKGFRINNSLYYKFLFRDPLFVAKVKERWPELVANLDGMNEYIDGLNSLLLRGAARDKTIWPSTYAANYDEKLSVPDAIARLKSALNERLGELTSLIDALEATPVNSNAGNENFGDQTNPDFGFGF